MQVGSFICSLTILISLLTTSVKSAIKSEKCTGGYVRYNGGLYRCGCWQGSCWSKCPYLKSYEWCLTTDSYKPGKVNKVNECTHNGDCSLGFQCTRGPTVCRWQPYNVRQLINRDRNRYVVNNKKKLNTKKRRYIEDLPSNTEMDIVIKCNDKYKKSRAIYNNSKRRNVLKSNVQHCIQHHRRAYEKMGYLETTDPESLDDTQPDVENVMSNNDKRSKINVVEKRVFKSEKIDKDDKILEIPAYDFIE